MLTTHRLSNFLSIVFSRMSGAMPGIFPGMALKKLGNGFMSVLLSPPHNPGTERINAFPTGPNVGNGFIRSAPTTHNPGTERTNAFPAILQMLPSRSPRRDGRPRPSEILRPTPTKGVWTENLTFFSNGGGERQIPRLRPTSGANRGISGRRGRQPLRAFPEGKPSQIKKGGYTLYENSRRFGKGTGPQTPQG